MFEGVCEQIRQKLLAGELKPGDRLPAERELAIELGVGRPAVREALRTLEICGIVDTRKGVKGGAFVREGSASMLTRSFQDLVMLGHISPRSLAEARMMINALVVRLACERGTSADFDAIEDNLVEIQRLTETGDLVGRAEAGMQFFHLIAQATHNEVLAVLAQSLSMILRYFVIEKQPARVRAELVPMRWNILKYLRAGATDAAVAEVARYLELMHGNLVAGTPEDKVPELAEAGS